MFNSTSILIYTLFYIIVSICFVFKTTEFVSNGLTVENLFENFVGKEYDNFIVHHIKRTSLTIIIHSSIPLVYLLGTLLANDSEEEIVYQYFYELFCLALIPVVLSCSVLYKWMSNNWANHPLVKILIRYDPGDWMLVAREISMEYQCLQKLTLSCGTLTRIIVTDNWVLSINLYSVNIAKKMESSFVVYSSDNHNTSPDGNLGSVQFINIQVIPIRARVKSFFIRIKSEDFKTLEEKIGQPIQIADNIKLQRSRTERFIEVFRDEVRQNPVYSNYSATDIEDSICAGCLVNPPDIKLTKCCEDNDDTDLPKCSSCQCRPMWCVDCMAKWYESRQPQNNETLWLSSKCTCPLCRRVFCILDVCALQNSELARVN
ncbi:E3 ubiquitin-protein ligase TM129 [Daktulosphaira vitifoliae]|uniref:E3 ubiquitin-protein ligase TM129 n=1 Tax=Daktulosphaira vitifoliae TaxID=58002 RepID=UPI0021AA79A5|nr:E3 ubiquitin-protein ligase TM129 [Daktulosphaira vitifoliae]